MRTAPMLRYFVGRWLLMLLAASSLYQRAQAADLDPIWRGAWRGDWIGPARAVAAQNQYAYVGTLRELAIIDLSDPSQPRLAGSLTTGQGVSSVAVSGRYAYLAIGWGGLCVVDISNPAQPAVVGVYPTDLLSSPLDRLHFAGLQSFVWIESMPWQRLTGGP